MTANDEGLNTREVIESITRNSLKPSSMPNYAAHVQKQTDEASSNH